MERVDSFIPFITKENFNFKDAIRSSPSLFEQKIVFV
jgi:hypothetical protein